MKATSTFSLGEEVLFLCFILNGGRRQDEELALVPDYIYTGIIRHWRGERCNADLSF
ncbi:hypothetical protein KZX62_06350 [Paenibacillus silvae]|nr:hypothetical protein [Paenibacillus silvae]